MLKIKWFHGALSGEDKKIQLAKINKTWPAFVKCLVKSRHCNQEWESEIKVWFSVQLIGTHTGFEGMLCRINILSTDNLQFNLKNVFFSLNKPHAAPYERSISQGIRKRKKNSIKKLFLIFPLTLFHLSCS